MKCAQARSLFSPYLDGILTGAQMRALGDHLHPPGFCLKVKLRFAQTGSETAYARDIISVLEYT